MSSDYGKILKISIFGESHSNGIGVVISGIPAGEFIDTEAVLQFMKRRAPSDSISSTSRKEADIPEILSGIVDGKTCGSPISAIIRNTDVRSKDYNEIKYKPRPSHADYAAFMKYGDFHDIRGGGHFSGRLTAPLCFAGAVCQQILHRKGIFTNAKILSIGDVQSAVDDGDSVGGVIECCITGIPAGVGEPMFEGVENKVAQAVFAVPAVKGIEFGSPKLRGSDNNDEYRIVDGKVQTITNNSGGITGGLTNGMPVIFRVTIKPTPSISKEQRTVDLRTMTDTTISITGRHDPCIVPRAVPCIESAAMIAVLDLLYERQSRL